MPTMPDARADRPSWPAHGLESIANCPVCGSVGRRVLHKRLTDRVFFCAPGEWTLYKCSDCGCGYLDPRPTVETIHLAYRTYYTHTPSLRVKADALGTSRRLRRALANGFRNWRFGANLHPSNKLGVIVTWLVPGQRQLLEREFRHLPRSAPGLRLLDVGCGNGAFLELAREAGWHVTGTDPDPVSVESARKRGLEVRLGGIETFADMAERFDVITLNHVIEHVHDPRKVIKDVYRLLKPGGRAWMETPNIDSHGHEQFGCNWRGLEPPRHLVLFNWHGLESILSDAGFRMLRGKPRLDVYSSLATASKAIVNGRDPYEDRSQGWAERIAGSLYSLRARINYRRSEYVTIIASKPLIEREER